MFGGKALGQMAGTLIWMLGARRVRAGQTYPLSPADLSAPGVAFLAVPPWGRAHSPWDLPLGAFLLRAPSLIACILLCRAQPQAQGGKGAGLAP